MSVLEVFWLAIFAILTDATVYISACQTRIRHPPFGQAPCRRSSFSAASACIWFSKSCEQSEGRLKGTAEFKWRETNQPWGLSGCGRLPRMAPADGSLYDEDFYAWTQ